MPKRPPKPKPELPKTLNIVGEPLNWTDEDIERMATVTQEDVFSAVAAWEANAPKGMKKLLRARKVKGK